MKAVPTTRHAIAVLIFAAVSALAGLFALYDDRVADDQVRIATAAVKRHQPALFDRDPVFGDSGLWRFHTPAMQAVMELLLAPTGYRDPTLPFRVLAGVSVMVYLCGMYALLYRQCRSWSIAAAVAVLSMAVVYGPAGSQWGIGSLASVTPASLCLAISPLVVLAFLRYERQWALVLVFAFVGLLGNLHLATAMNLTLVLAITYLGRRGFAPQAWLMAAACGLCALAAAMPYVFYYFGLRQSLTPAGATTSYAAVSQALRKFNVLYPRVLQSLLEWDLLIRLLVLGIAAGAVLSRVERFRVAEMTLWIWLMIASLFVSFALHGISQLVGVVRSGAPPVIDLIRASGLIMLPLYALLAQALTNLFRLFEKHRAALRWTVAMLGAVWLAPSDNLRVVRHAVYDGYDAIVRSVKPSEQARGPLRHRVRQARYAELEAIGQWARDRTDTSDVFITERSDIRIYARRPIVASPEDMRYFYYMSPWRLEDWSALLQRQKQLLHPPGGKIEPAALRQFVDELAAADEWKGPQHWYLILAHEADMAGRADVRGMQKIPPAGWGRYWCLYRLR